MNSYLTAALAILGPFAGAWGAYRFEGRQRKSETIERNVGAANRAITIIQQYWNSLEQYRLVILEPYRDDEINWLNCPAYLSNIRPADRFHPTELQFLLPQYASVYLALFREERRFDLALALINERSRLLQQEVRPNLSAHGIEEKQKVPIDDIKQIIGHYHTATLKQLTAGIYKNVPEDLETLKELLESLTTAMKTIYPKKETINVKLG